MGTLDKFCFCEGIYVVSVIFSWSLKEMAVVLMDIVGFTIFQISLLLVVVKMIRKTIFC